MHKGIAVSPGVVVGVAYRVDSVFGSSEPQTLDDPGLVPAEIERFDRAVAASAAELEAIVAEGGAAARAPAEADIFKSHLQIVNDQALLAKVHALIETQHLTALSALQVVMQGYAATFARIEQDYFRERMTDVRDVISRIGSHLTRKPGRIVQRRRHGLARRRRAGDPGRARDPAQPGDEPGQPADRRDRHRDRRRRPATPRSCRGAGASPPSRASSGSPTTSARGDLMIVDGRDGHRHRPARPRGDRRLSQDAARVLRPQGPARPEPRPAGRAAPTARRSSCWPTSTTSPTPRPPQKVGATGVGLFRTEYLFLTHQDVPDEEEQYQHYRQIIEDSPEPDRDDPDPRPRRRQDGPLPRPAERGQPVHGLAVDPALVRAPPPLRAADPRHPPRRPARQGLDALPDDHHPGRAAVRQPAGRGDAAEPPPRGGAVRRGRQDRA